MTGRATKILGIACTLVLVAIVAPGSSPARAAEAPVGLGAATSFAVLAGQTITNTGPSVISGDVGVNPGSAVTGFPPGLVNNGAIHAADATSLNAQASLGAAYGDAAGRPSTAPISSDLGGRILVAGVYTGGALALTGSLTLDAQGDPNAVFIFQAASSLITASGSTMSLVNGAQACNVFWQVGSSATLGTASTFIGTIMALTSVSAATGASVVGRLLARNGSVTLDTNVISPAGCAVSPPSTTTPGASTTTPSGGTAAPGATVPPTTPGGGTVPGATTPGGGTVVATTPSSGLGSTTVPGQASTIPATGPPNAATVTIAGAFALLGGVAILVLLARHPRRTRLYS